jgi:hypothetical protein
VEFLFGEVNLAISKESSTGRIMPLWSCADDQILPAVEDSSQLSAFYFGLTADS